MDPGSLRYSNTCFWMKSVTLLACLKLGSCLNTLLNLGPYVNQVIQVECSCQSPACVYFSVLGCSWHYEKRYSRAVSSHYPTNLPQPILGGTPLRMRATMPIESLASLLSTAMPISLDWNDVSLIGTAVPWDLNSTVWKSHCKCCLNLLLETEEDWLSMLTLLHSSAAFDITDHKLWLMYLGMLLGVAGVTLVCLFSFLYGWSVKGGIGHLFPELVHREFHRIPSCHPSSSACHQKG